MVKKKIIGIDTIWYGTTQRFHGFRLEDTVGAVDPFVGAEFEVAELKTFEDNDGDIPASKVKAFIAAELKWARSQVGKELTCNELHYKAFATSGPVNID